MILKERLLKLADIKCKYLKTINQLETLEKEKELLRIEYDELAKEIWEALRHMDCVQSGNFGFEKRWMNLLMELVLND